MKKIFVLFAILLFSVGAAAQTPDEAVKLVAETLENKSGNEFADYYFKLTSVLLTAKKGKPSTESKIYEIFVPSKMPARRVNLPLILIAENGAPLSEKKIQNQRVDAAKNLEKIELEAERNETDKNSKAARDGYLTASVQTGNVFNVDYITFSPFSALTNSELSNARREKINGRIAVALDFRPRANASFDAHETYLNSVEGTIYIDETDKKIIRVNGFPIGKLAANKDKNEVERETESALFYEQTRVAENLWMPVRIHFKGLKYPRFFGKLPADAAFFFTDFKRFRATVEDAIIKSN